MRELLKVYNVDRQIDNRDEMACGKGQPLEEVSTKVGSKSKKENNQEVLQRSRNAITGATDALLGVATIANMQLKMLKRPKPIYLLKIRQNS